MDDDLVEEEEEDDEEEDSSVYSMDASPRTNHNLNNNKEEGV